MKVIYRLFILFIVLLSFGSRGQTDTIIVYDALSKTIDTILPVPVDTSLTFNKTSSFIGSLGNKVNLSIVPPTTNLFSNSNYSDLARATNFFTLTDYPVRTAVKLAHYQNGILSQVCSGIMVGEEFVLTSGHCIYDYYFGQSNNFTDSVYAFPAYNMGIQQTLPYSMVKKIYIFKTFYNYHTPEDVALLQLKQPIGSQTGWTGIGYTTDTSFYTGKVFHKFSYPGQTMNWDTTKHYNGDTLYYNYGYINDVSSFYLGVLSPDAKAIPGQSGSTFLFTDNSEYYSMGLATWSNNYLHYKIKRDAFYQLQNILDNYATPVNSLEENNNGNEFVFYPNPVYEKGLLQLKHRLAGASLRLFNSMGQQVNEIKNISGNTVIFYRENLPAGIYSMQLTQRDKIILSQKIIINDN